jgi:ketosteroid isomerase-like protein
MDRVATVQAVYDAFKAGDRDKLRELIDENVIWHGNEGNPSFGGTINGLNEFFDQAFKYKDVLESVEIIPEAILSDGKIAMSRQKDIVHRVDGTSQTYMFNVYYEFNEKGQFKEVWEVTNSDWAKFP